MRLVYDIEAKNLLNSISVDYKASPYVLKDPEFVHCVAFTDVDTGKEYEFVQGDVKHAKEFVLDCATELIGHNIISYDNLAMKAAHDWEVEIGVFEGDRTDTFYDRNMDSFCGKPITITDTLVMSKCLNPDRTMHSIAYFGKCLGLEKIDWRAKAIELGLIAPNAPKGEEFRVYHPEMLVYCKRDIAVNVKAWKMLLGEWGQWDWRDAYELEKAVADVITRQEHRGFWFDTDKALENVRDLDIKMEALREIVEPLIPPKPLTKGAAKEFIPPKIQFKKNGEPSALIQKWAEKHGGKLVQEADGWNMELPERGQYKLPMPLEPIVTHMPAKINDTTHIKHWLVNMGWAPTAWKERDLTLDAKKHKLTPEAFEAAVDRYVEQTLNSPFKNFRLEELDCTAAGLHSKLLKHDLKRPLKVYTNPTLTVGMDKEVDPALLEMKDKFPYAKQVSEYLTYSHRRNSILGGGVDPDDFDDDDEFSGKGYLAADRINQDHRIPTPADTCGAGTSRFKHRLVCNVPRVTSLYGKEMRALFGVDAEDGFIQIGYDYDSLEARCEAHYTYKYKGGPEYGVSLTAEKPGDCHTVLATSISKLLGRPFPRGTAKNVKYGASYNAQVPRIAKTVGCTLEEAQIIFDAFWTQAYPLKQLKEAMQKYWETTGHKKFLLGIDGRKLPIRSKGNVINTAFQSCGVICAKRAMVIHDRMLKAEGMSVDFWTEDWRNKDFCQQIIAYHDEAQLEIRRSLVTWKKFAGEEDCKAFKSEDGKVWSEPVHTDKGWFRGYCRAGELAVQAVSLSGEYYKLNVPLTAGYNLGKNWASTH